jgi:hypothetical protein
MSEVTIRIWDGCTVRYVFSVGPTGSSTIGGAGGAANSTRPDIELDPWARLIVDGRAEWPRPVSIVEEPESAEEWRGSPPEPEHVRTQATALATALSPVNESGVRERIDVANDLLDALTDTGWRLARV